MCVCCVEFIVLLFSLMCVACCFVLLLFICVCVVLWFSCRVFHVLVSLSFCYCDRVLFFFIFFDVCVLDCSVYVFCCLCLLLC